MKKRHQMKIISFKRFVYSILCICIYCNPLFAENVKVGAYHFPPFVVVDKNNNKVEGITKKLIHEMNLLQKKIKFELFLTSPSRRFYDFDQKNFDLIMFEDIKWGWKNKDIVASNVFLKGGEVYITKADPSKNQSYFDSLKDKHIAIIKGYHYGFANFNSDEKYLKNHFKIQFSSYHEGNILKVIFGRADISIVNLCYLRSFLLNHPEKKNQILISEKFDQRYNHTILARKNSAVKMSEINQLLSQMEKSGTLSRIACSK